MSATILVVEDEPAIQTLVAACLQNAGHQVVRADTAEDAIRRVNEILPDVVLLDWMLPGMSGIQLARRLRGDERTHDLPIIMLTARADTSDVVVGLEAGADDYIVKPFNPKELVARIRTRLRPVATDVTEVLRVGDLTVDVAAHEVRRGSEAIALTPLEFELLVALASKPQQVFSREMLLEQVWGYHYKADTRLVNVHVQRLRAKVEIDPDIPKIVTTVRGVGYRAGAVV